jgi:DNA invertase Pin-like site-specific DNA recombinase
MTRSIREDIEWAVKATIKVAIYTRVSTDIQEEEGTSLETQIENCLQLAALYTRTYYVHSLP